MVEALNLESGEPVTGTFVLSAAGRQIMTGWEVMAHVNENSAAISAACAWYELNSRVREV